MKRSKFLAGLLSACLLFSSLPVAAAEPEARINPAVSSYALEDEGVRASENESGLAEDDAPAMDEGGAGSAVEGDGGSSGGAAGKEKDAKKESAAENAGEGVSDERNGDKSDEAADESKEAGGKAAGADGSIEAGSPEKSEDGDLGNESNVEINATNFPDEVFRNYVSENFDTDSDGVLSAEEISGVSCININYKSIESLEGIKYFTNLTMLFCEGNKLTELDLSSNMELEQLDCKDNQLTRLDVSKNVKLRWIRCKTNVIEELILPESGGDLWYLNCSNNKLTSLDVSSCSFLLDLCCDRNKLTSLDVSQNYLTRLYCWDNNLTSLDISQNEGLQYLGCSDNNLISLDLSQNELLEYLDCSGTNLTSLDLSKNTSLHQLKCNDNNLTTLDLSNNKYLYGLICLGNNRLKSIDMRGNCVEEYMDEYRAWRGDDDIEIEDIMYIIVPPEATVCCDEGSTVDNYCKNNYIKYSYGSPADIPDISDSTVSGNNPGRDDTNVEINATNFPDSTFRDWLIKGNLKDSSGKAIPVNGNSVSGYYFEAEVRKTPVRIAIDSYQYNSIASYKGIENFEGLYYLELYRYGYFTMEELDLSKNVMLQEIYCQNNEINKLILPDSDELVKLNCGGNNLEELDLSKNTALTELYCGGNNLEELDLSKNTALTKLYCGFDKWKSNSYFNKNKKGNNISELDLSKNTALIELSCALNSITKLDISNNTALTYLNCGSNELESLNISNNTALTELLCGGNNLTELDLNNNTALTKLYCWENKLTELDLSNNTLLESLSCDDNPLTSLNVSNNTALEYLGCNNSNLEELNISNNTALKGLECTNNKLSKVDISGNTELCDLNCSNNNLTELNVSGNTALEYLDCGNNNLTKLNVSNNTELDRLSCNNNKLTELIVENNTKLYYLGCYSNELKNLDVSSNIELGEINCNDNKLTSLDLSKNLGLYSIKCKHNSLEELMLPENDVQYLRCGDNKLRSLDVSHCSELYRLYCDRNELTNLDVSHCPELKVLNCDSNKLTNLDISQNAWLEVLYCNDNNLTNLDLSQNTGLSSLHCDSNNLTSLDLSKNEDIGELHCNNNNLTTLDLSNSKYLYRLICLGNDRLKSIDMRGNSTSSMDEWCVERMYLIVPPEATVCCDEGGLIDNYCRNNYIKYSYGSPTDIPDISDSTVSGNNPTVSGNNPTVSGNNPTVSGNNPTVSGNNPSAAILGDLKDAVVTLSASCIKAKKNDAAQKPLPKKVTLNGAALKNNKDYTISYTYNGTDGKAASEKVAALTKAGIYEIVLTAKDGGRCTGSQSVAITVAEINKTLMSTVKVTLEKNKYDYKDYNGEEIKPAVTSVKSGKKTLTEGTDYTVSYADNRSSGKGRVILTAVSGSSYAGTKEVTFDIIGIKMSKVKAAGITPSLKFNGSGSIVQDLSKIKLTYNGKDSSGKAVNAELAEGVDYTVSYENNNSAGTAKIVFTGKGLYNGALKKTFKISKVGLDRSMLSTDAITALHSKAGAKPDVTLTYNGTKLVNGRDYTISYKKNKAVSSTSNKPTLTIKGKGSYAGSIKDIEFTITQQDVNSEDITVAAPDVAYNKKKNTYTTKLKVYDNGALMKANKDYTVEYAGNDISALPAESGRAAVTVTIKGNGGYGGSRTQTFYVVEKLISGLSAKVTGTHTYEGTPVTLSQSEIVITDKKNSNHQLTSAEFEIVGYTANDRAGTAKVEVRGLGKYGGTKIIKFKIAKKK